MLDEWGYLIQDEDGESVDTGQPAVQDGPTPEDVYEPIEWTYAYWLWKSYGSGGATERLEQWQALLVSALSARGAKVGLAVGVMGKQPHDYAVGLFDGHWIAFLNDQREPTPEMAAKAAEALMHDMQHPI